MLTSLGALLITGALAPSGFTQQSGGGYTLHPTVTTGGGGASTNGTTWRLEGSIGQSVLGTSSATPLSINSGFWPNAVPCPFNVSPRGQFFTVAGGPGSVNIVAPGFCNWTTAVAQEWIIITSKDSGSGNEVVNFEVRENFTGSARQASINVSGLTQVIVQDAGLGEDCSYAINPQFQSFSSGRGTGTITIAAEDRCAWQAAAIQSWITITSLSVGIGNGTVTYSVATNPGNSGRSGTITIAGKTFNVKQKGQ